MQYILEFIINKFIVLGLLKYLLVKDFQPLAQEIDHIARMICRFIKVVKNN